MSTIKITVTKRDIRDGVCGNPRHCAVALALQRVFPDHVPSVGSYGVRLYKRDVMGEGNVFTKPLHYNVSTRLFQFLTKFDRLAILPRIERMKLPPQTFILTGV